MISGAPYVRGRLVSHSVPDAPSAHRSKRVQLIPRVNFSILCFGHSLDLAELGNEHISCKRGDWAAQWPLKGVLFSPTLKIRKKSVFWKSPPLPQNSFIYGKMVTIPNVGAHGRSEMVNLKGVHHKYQSRLKRSGKIVNFCPFSEQRFSMIPADSQAPLRVCYSHDMSRHPIERIEASSGQFLRN